MKNKRNNRLNKIKTKRIDKEEYGYDFVPELSHILNIDEQRENARRLEDIGKNDIK